MSSCATWFFLAFSGVHNLILLTKNSRNFLDTIFKAMSSFLLPGSLHQPFPGPHPPFPFFAPPAPPLHPDPDRSAPDARIQPDSVRSEYSIASLTSTTRSPSAKRAFAGFNQSQKNSGFGGNIFPYRDREIPGTDIRSVQQSSPETSSSEKFSDNSSDDQVIIKKKLS